MSSHWFSFLSFNARNLKIVKSIKYLKSFLQFVTFALLVGWFLNCDVIIMCEQLYVCFSSSYSFLNVIWYIQQPVFLHQRCLNNLKSLKMLTQKKKLVLFLCSFSRLICLLGQTSYFSVCSVRFRIRKSVVKPIIFFVG